MSNSYETLRKMTLTDVAAMIHKKEVSPVDLVDACLEQIDKYDGHLRAFITVEAEQSRKVAKASEDMLMAGYDMGPLHGIPLSLKDNIGVKGRRTTAGSAILKDNYPAEDATVVRHLKGDGAIIIGKNNMHEFAWGGTTDNEHYGTCRNPWDDTRFPAGSSGGSGAALAAGMWYGALGTDTGGSIRLPSALHGTVGLRPTLGRVSNHGVVPLAWSQDTVGPMTRTVADCALLFNSIAGHDYHDPSTVLRPVEDYTKDLTAGVKNLRIGIDSSYFFKDLQPGVKSAVLQALKTFESMGAHIVEVPIEHIAYNTAPMLTVEASEPSTYHQRWIREQPERYANDVRTMLETGEFYLATHYINAQRFRRLLRNEFMDGFKQCDIYITPTLAYTALPIGQTEFEADGAMHDYLGAQMQFTGLPSLTGLPGMSVPCGFDAQGLPVGMQIIGRPFDEAFMFRVGAAFQQVTDYHKKTPVL